MLIEKSTCSLKIRDFEKFVGDWCNGSTRDFDSLGTSSILVSPAKHLCVHNSMVEYQLPKLGVAGSIPVAR